MSDSDETSSGSKKRTLDEYLKEKGSLEKSKTVTKKPTMRNLEADYDKAEEAALNEEEKLKEVAKKPTVRKLEFDVKPTDEQPFKEAEEDDDALPLTCPICKEPFFDPVVTRCNHYFCKYCILEHQEKDKTCFVCKQPTLEVPNAAVEINQKIAQVREKAKGMLKEVTETLKKAMGIVTDAEAMNAESAKMVEEVERLVGIAETFRPNSMEDPVWLTVVSLVNHMDNTAAQAKKMAEKAEAMVRVANATVETAKGEMAKALGMIKNVKWV